MMFWKYIDQLMVVDKTQIKFKRRIIWELRSKLKTNTAYIAMEYCNGKIIQCRYDHNVAVEDSNIINFANALAERLAKENILAA